MSVQTSQVTSGSGDDLTLDPATGKNLKITTTLDTANPGETPLATTTADGTVKRLDVNNLDLHGPALDENDWVMVQDASDSKRIKKRKATDVGGTKQPLLSDPLPADSIWVDQTSTLAVKEGGSGSTADLRNSVEFAVINNTFNQSDKSINANDRIQVRWMESKMITANHGQTISGTLYAKTGSKFTQTWNLTVTKQPTAGWDIAPLIGQPASTELDSSLSFPSGFNAPSPVTIDGGTLTGIQVSVNGAAFTSSPGNIISGQTIQVRGTTGGADDTTYTALVSIGGIQRTWNVTTAASVLAVAQPTIDSPVDGAVDISPTVTITSSAYTPLNGASATHASSDWEIQKVSDGSTVVQSLADTVNLESFPVPFGNLEGDVEYRVRVLHRSSDPVDSPFSDWSSFKTEKVVLPKDFVSQILSEKYVPNASVYDPTTGNHIIQNGMEVFNATLTWKDYTKSFYSTDGGQTWRLSGSEHQTGAAGCIADEAGKVWVWSTLTTGGLSSVQGQASTSTNGGQTWNVGVPNIINKPPASMKSATHDGNGTFLSVHGTGVGTSLVYKTTDYGMNWTSAGAFTSAGAWHGCATDRKGVWMIAGQDQTSGNCYLQRSLDNLSTWESVQTLSNALTGGSLRGLTTSGNGTWIACCKDKVIRSTDNGATWSNITMPSLGGSLTFLQATYGNGVFAAVGNGLSGTPNSFERVIYSEDDGLTWKGSGIDAGKWDTRTIHFGGGKWVVSGSDEYSGDYRTVVWIAS